MVHEQGKDVVLDMHMAKTNAQWKEFFDDEVMVVFSGPHAYVSPRWYEDQRARADLELRRGPRLRRAQADRGLEAKSTQSQRRLVAALDPKWLPQFDALRQEYVDSMLDGIVNFQIARHAAGDALEAVAEPQPARAGADRGAAREVRRFGRARARRADPKASDRRVKVVVLGAGLAGVTTAWYLAKEGHEVLVIDREAEVAASASYSTTGIVAASRAYPWAGGELGRAMRQAGAALRSGAVALGHAAPFPEDRTLVPPPARGEGAPGALLAAAAARAGARDRLHARARRALPVSRCRGARRGFGARRPDAQPRFRGRAPRPGAALPARAVARCFAGCRRAVCARRRGRRRGALLPRPRRALPHARRALQPGERDRFHRADERDAFARW